MAYYASIKACRGILVIIFYYFLIISTPPCDGGAAIGPNCCYRARLPSVAKEAFLNNIFFIFIKYFYI